MRIGCPLTALRFSMAPDLLMSACNTTSPCTWAIFAICGYGGSTLLIRLPSATPEEMRSFCGAATLGGGAVDLIRPPITPPAEPPGTPPTTPPTTPVLGGGASSSLIISIFLGILLGVRSSPLTISLTRGTVFTTGAGGGGGGGGGGGATIAAISIRVGRPSVMINGIRIRIPISTA